MLYIGLKTLLYVSAVGLLLSAVLGVEMRRVLKQKVYRKGSRQDAFIRKWFPRVKIAFFLCFLLFLFNFKIISADGAVFESFQRKTTDPYVFLYVLDDPQKTLKGAFQYDAVASEVQLEKNEIEEYYEMLNIDISRDADLTVEELQEIVSETEKDIFKRGSLREGRMEDLSVDKRRELENLASQIRCAQKNYFPAEREYLQQEAELSRKSYEILPVNKMIFQAGRANEDLFWTCSEDGVFTDQLKYAAMSVEAFTLFLEHADREILVDGAEQIMFPEKVAQREGKVLFHLGQCAPTDGEVRGILCKVYALFDIQLSSECYHDSEIRNENLAMTHYYFAATCEYLLEYADEDLYIRLCQRGITSCDEALRLWILSESYHMERGDLPEETERLRDRLQDREKRKKRMAEETEKQTSYGI